MTQAAVVQRGTLVAVGAVLLLALGLSSPALAAEGDVDAFNGEFAVADWSLNDARNTEVDVGAFDGRIVGAQLPEDRASVYLSVRQSYCDEEANEQVRRTYFGFSRDGASVDGVTLSEAVAHTDMTVHGFEVRSRGCDDDDFFFDTQSHTDLGEHDVHLSADWEATGPMDPTVSNFQYSNPDFVFSSSNVERSRQAKATGTLFGLPDVGPELGTSDRAQIVSVIHGSVSVRR